MPSLQIVPVGSLMMKVEATQYASASLPANI
jgi:hypothetical protein